MIQQPLPKELETHIKSLQADRIDTFLLEDGTVRGTLLHGTRMINAMRENHNLGILESYILGHAYIAVGLMTSMLKGNDRIGLSIECGGPAKGLDVEANANGDIRGYLRQNPIPISKPLESFDMSPFFGPGFISVIRNLEGSKQPVSGQTMMRHGSIARDLANHFLESEQTPTLFFLSIHFNKQGDITGAGGLFLQVMPGVEEGALERIEHASLSMPSIGQWFAEERSSSDLITETFSDYTPQIIGTRDVGFYCGCERTRFLEFISSLTGETRESILHDGPFPLELTCHNCGTTYAFEKEEIRQILN